MQSSWASTRAQYGLVRRMRELAVTVGPRLVSPVLLHSELTVCGAMLPGRRGSEKWILKMVDAETFPLLVNDKYTTKLVVTNVCQGEGGDCRVLV